MEEMTGKIIWPIFFLNFIINLAIMVIEFVCNGQKAYFKSIDDLLFLLEKHRMV